MNQTHTADTPHRDRKFADWRRRVLAITGVTALASVLITVGCSSNKGDQEPTVTVQVAAVEKTTIQQTINTQAILFAKQQAAIVPKISAPVKKFLVKRGSAVREGQLLAVLENRDLMKRTFPQVFEGLRVRPVDDYPSNLLEMLESIAPPA